MGRIFRSLVLIFAFSVPVYAEFASCVPPLNILPNPLEQTLQNLPVRRLESSQLHFGVIGDWGGKDWGRRQFDVVLPKWVHNLNSTAESSEWTFVVNVGDSFYPHGIDSVDSPRWQSGFEKLFVGKGLEKLYFYSVLGNHDFNAPAQPLTQIAYSYSKNTRWCMPNFYYSYRYQLADFGATFIAIDSNSLLHECRGGCQSKTPGTCAAEEHRPNPTCKQSFVPKYKEQMHFLEKEIRKAKDLGDWVLVFMHHPMASIGENYGFDVGPEWGFAVLRDQVGGLLSHYNVDVLFAGHEHLLELLLARPNQMPIVITGSAGYANGVLSCRVGKQCDDKLDLQYGNYKYQSKFATPLEGFADIDLSKKELTIKFIGPGTQELYRYTRVRSDKKTTLHEGL